VKWLSKHKKLKQLTFQSAIQAMSNREEFVKEMLISESKLPSIIYDLLLVEIWREKIFHSMKSIDPQHTSLSIYPILYHEAMAMNILETTLYHSESFETMGDSVIDFVDYCLRAINQLLIPDREQTRAQTEPNIYTQPENILTGISFKAITCIRFVIENLDDIGRGLISRLTVSADTPMLLTDLLLQKPWKRTNSSGTTMEYSTIENEWKTKDAKTLQPSLLLSPVEIQTWLALYLLLKNNDILASYELFDHRKEHLLKLRPLFNQVMTDQVPLLGELQLFLNQLSVHSGPLVPNKKTLLIEMIPQLRTSLEKVFCNEETKGKLIDRYEEELVDSSMEKTAARARLLTDVYNFESFEAVLPTKHKCELCGHDAERKCSKCRKAWYCTRECQVKHWKIHKEKCN